ncbi:MAG: hypothetical protein HY652_09460, partial [Acidobacteria bacterium]|nr:hypothetical protein [Acidobacteriota bacterium]
MKRALVAVSMWSLLLVVPVWAQQLPEEIILYADTIFHNGIVLTVDREDPNFTVAQAVAVRNG